MTQMVGLDMSQGPVTFTETVHFPNFATAHNIFINEDTGYAYVVGSNLCSGGLYIIDIENPLSPTFEACFSADGYVHDVQCKWKVWRQPTIKKNVPQTYYAPKSRCYL